MADNGAAATALIFWLGNVKEEYSRRESAQLELQTAQVTEAAAKAHERAAEHELKLEQLRKQVGPRRIQDDVFRKATEGQPKATVAIWYVKDDPGSHWLAYQIFVLLQEAKWEVLDLRPIPPVDDPILQSVPSPLTLGGNHLAFQS